MRRDGWLISDLNVRPGHKSTLGPALVPLVAALATQSLNLSVRVTALEAGSLIALFWYIESTENYLIETYVM